MFRRIRTYELVIASDRTEYRPRAYADPQRDGSWDGYLAFFPLPDGPVAVTGRQITGPTLAAVIDWADTLTPIDLDSALARAKTLRRASMLEDEIERLDYLERDALSEAETLEEDAALDKASAEVARANAERLRRERLRAEADLAASEERAASSAATAYEREAQGAREEAVEAKRRRRLAEESAAAERTRSKP